MSKRINDAGLKEIAEFLAQNHVLAKDDPDYFNHPSMLNAWAEDVHKSLSEGNGAEFEIRGADSITGNPVCCTISDEGLTPSKTITLNLPERDPEDPAPLYCKFQNQSTAQPAFIELDLRTGKVTADYSSEIGNSVPSTVWHGIERRYPIRADLTASQIREVVDDIIDDLQTIYENSDVEWDGNNYTGVFSSEEAADLDMRLGQDEPLGYDKEDLVITDLAEWLSDTKYWPDSSEDIDQFFEDFDLDGYQVAKGQTVKDTLLDMWADDLYSGEILHANMAAYLEADGRCNDSAWTEELSLMARSLSAYDQVDLENAAQEIAAAMVKAFDEVGLSWPKEAEDAVSKVEQSIANSPEP